MKIFIAHKVAGEDLNKLKVVMEGIAKALEKAGHGYYCTFIDETNNPKKFKGWKTEDFMFDALKILDNSDAILVYVNSFERAEGPLIESGYALAKKKKIILAVNRNIPTAFLRGISTKVIEFDDITDLCKQLEAFK
jgi:nucleoside 2-deoxyribosyltransferase